MGPGTFQRSYSIASLPRPHLLWGGWGAVSPGGCRPPGTAPQLPPPTAGLCGRGPMGAPSQAESQRAGGSSIRATRCRRVPLCVRAGGSGAVLVAFGGRPPRRVPAPTSSRGLSGTSPRWGHWVPNDRPSASGRRGRVHGAFCAASEAPRPRAWASFYTDSWTSTHLRSLLGRRPSHRLSPLPDLSPAEGRARSSWVMMAMAVCGPRACRAPCPPGPARTLQLARAAARSPLRVQPWGWPACHVGHQRQLPRTSQPESGSQPCAEAQLPQAGRRVTRIRAGPGLGPGKVQHILPSLRTWGRSRAAAGKTGSLGVWARLPHIPGPRNQAPHSCVVLGPGGQRSSVRVPLP